MTQPFIGITLDHQPQGGYSEFPWYALRQNYCDAVVAAGGIPFLIPYVHEHIDAYLNKIQGLLMPGGFFDIPPQTYGQNWCHQKNITHETRSTFDYRILTKALAKGLPFLGICAGQQMLNVVLGGTLHQHIADAIPNALEHEQKIPRNLPSHPIIIKKGTRLHEISGRLYGSVNSTHHQAVDQLGTKLSASAHAPDGVIEAIELPDHPFCLGVEWHPEYQETELDRSLFNHFIKVAAYGSYR